MRPVAVSPDSPSSPAHNAPGYGRYPERWWAAPAALSLRPCCWGVFGVIGLFGGAATAPAIRGCRACTGGGKAGPAPERSAQKSVRGTPCWTAPPKQRVRSVSAADRTDRDKTPKVSLARPATTRSGPVLHTAQGEAGVFWTTDWEKRI